jgi:hypothetical protein
MSSRVSAAAAYQIDSLAGDGLNRIPHDPLDADVILLDLPPMVAGAVKGERQTNVSGRFHRLPGLIAMLPA